MASPTQVILDAAAATRTVTDSEGRTLQLRRLNALDKLRLFKALGPVLAQNEAYLGMAMLACSVSAIHDMPLPFPGNETQLESLVARLGDVGLAAAATVFEPDTEIATPDGRTIAGN